MKRLIRRFIKWVIEPAVYEIMAEYNSPIDIDDPDSDLPLEQQLELWIRNYNLERLHIHKVRLKRKQLFSKDNIRVHKDGTTANRA